jgi:hypothetical protein
VNLNQLENEILSNRSNGEVINGVVTQLLDERKTLDWQIEKFLQEHCDGVTALQRTDLNTADPVYRYYNYKCDQYFQIERLLRVAKAYS